MAIIFKHPELKDYFHYAGIDPGPPWTLVPSIVKAFEYARLIHFPRLDLNIDHEFWAGLPIVDGGGVKTLESRPGLDEFAQDGLLERSLDQADLLPQLKQRLQGEIARLYGRILPLCRRLFSGYDYRVRRVVWRLDTIRVEATHVDSGIEEGDEHVARLFVNLDDQPRIWTTSWTLEQMYVRFGERLPKAILRTGKPSDVHQAINEEVFGDRSWESQPRHVVYFEPGEVWAVDTRQVSHQVFYGRRAVCLEFSVDPQGMAKRKRHYLVMADRFRRHRLQHPETDSEGAPATCLDSADQVDSGRAVHVLIRASESSGQGPVRTRSPASQAVRPTDLIG